jgi:tRNA(Ile)-lysidine synthase
MLDILTLERMQATVGAGPILIALSGGGDSVALLRLMTERLGATRLRAAIVDHKLRAGSARDAEEASAIAARLGVQARVLELTWPDGATRAHEAARRLRYAELCSCARESGAQIIVTGHTRDDQAETVFLRASRGSGLRGLAAMRALAPAPVWPEGRGLWLARPLLGARRRALRDYLTTRKAQWIEDPANENDIYARVRVRRALARLERDGFDPMRLAQLAERLQPHADRTDREAAALIAEAVVFEADKAVLKRTCWRGADISRQRALSALVTAASGSEREPAQSQVEALCAAMEQPDFSGATLAGAWLRPRGRQIVFRRDPGALLGRAGGPEPIPALSLAPNQRAVWDGRVALAVSEPGWSVILDGDAPALQRDGERRPLAAASPQWLLRERVQHVLGTH